MDDGGGAVAAPEDARQPPILEAPASLVWPASPPDWETVRTLAARELLLTVRSRGWARLLAWFAFWPALLALAPAVYRSGPAHWQPTGPWWLRVWAVGTASGLLIALTGWTRRRIEREVRAGSLDEFILAGAGGPDVVLAKAASASLLGATLVLSAIPGGLLSLATGGEGWAAGLRLLVTLLLIGALAVCLGIEASFRRQGASCLTLMLLVLFFASSLHSAAMRFTSRGPGGGYELFLHYNPLATLLSAAGLHPERWTVGIAVLLVCLAAFTVFNLRALTGEWSRAAAQPDEAHALHGFIRPGVRRTRQLTFGSNPVADLDHAIGYRFRPTAGTLGWFFPAVVAAILAGARGSILPSLFWIAFAFSCLSATHSAVATVTRDRETGRWQDVSLTTLSGEALVRGKLGPLWPAWLPFGLACLPIAACNWAWYAPTPTTAWALWSVVTPVAVPPAAAAIGALIGLRSPSGAEGQWRAALLFAGLPALLITGRLMGAPVAAGAALSPVFAAYVFGRGDAGWAWIGTGAYVAAGLTAYALLCRRIRDWAVREG